MYFLIYTSFALHANEQELKTLLRQAREKNKRQSITGMLLYLNGIYIQLLEGRQEDVQSLYDIIRKDRRHKGVALLKQDSIEKLYFSEWSMGFKAISAEDLAGEESYRCLNAPSEQNITSVLKVFELLSSDR